MKQFFTLLCMTLFAFYHANAQQDISVLETMHSSEKHFIEEQEPHEMDVKAKHPDNLLEKHYEETTKQDFHEKSKATETDSCSVEDSLALVAIYNKMNGVNWTNQDNWLTGAPVKDWWGITVINHRVTVIDFYIDYNSTQNVSGTFAEELWSLNGLRYLNLARNQLEGSITPELGNLTNLEWLVLFDNQLEGSIPPELGNLTNLISLYLYNNQLEGSIPPELGNLTNLQWLSLYGNALTGSIPAELGNLTNLISLYLYNNQLEGSIPPELGSLTNLQRLYLISNQLEGSIPAELGSLINLQWLNLSGNALTGSIPPELGNLTNLQDLYLYNNQLEGSIPAELGGLTNLKWLNLSGNALTGSIPPELGNLTNLNYLYLYNNQLEGSIPPELGSLTNLERLYLQYNQLGGSIPSELGSLMNLQNLYLYSNQLEELPDLSGLNNLSYCYINNNHFTFGDLESASIDWNTLSGYSYVPQGLLPLDVDTTSNNVTLTVLAESPNNNYQWFKDGDTLTNETDSIFTYVESDESSYYCKITNNEFPDLTLQTTAVGANIQNGILDNDLNALVALYNNTDGDHWNDNSNWLSDEFAGNWYGVTVEGSRITEINLNNNNLSGTIPIEIGDLDSLKLLYIYSNNGITGSIPVEIGNLKALKRFAIAEEKLTGSIPVELSNLTKLEFLYLYSNELQGSIPAELGSLTNLVCLELNDNKLEGSFPAELGNLMNLYYLYLDNNQFEELPDLSGLNNLAYCYIYNNHFTFGDLETANIDWNALSDYTYHPQDILLPLDVDTVSNNVTLAVLAESPNNNYQWFKDGVELSGETDSTLTCEVNNNSIYYCKVTNSNFPDLTLETETFNNTAYSITFSVSNENTDAIEGAAVSIDGAGEKTTGANGEVAFELGNGNYGYTVNADGYDEITGNITVEGENVTENVTLIETTYSITFSVSNENADAIEGAAVSIDGEGEKTTGANGEVAFELVNGDYGYTVNADGYDETTGNITVEGENVTEKVTLIETTYSITFSVSNETADAIEGATVNIDGEGEKTTGANGEVIFELVNGDYDYTITAEGYEEATGSFNIEGSDITKNITLSAVSTYIHSVPGILTEVYPNPATERITIESELEIRSLELINLTGNMVFSDQPRAKKSILKINNLESGIYLLQINFENGKSETKRVVIE